MKIRPLYDRVVVRRNEEETTTAGGILLVRPRPPRDPIARSARSLSSSIVRAPPSFVVRQQWTTRWLAICLRRR